MHQNRLTVTNAPIIINIVVFVVCLVAQAPAIYNFPTPDGLPTPTTEILGSYSWYTCFTEGQLWRLISYQFLHANFGHVLFNMWALYFFGPAVELQMGGKKFLAFYLICGAAGALFSSLIGGLGLIGDMQTFLISPAGAEPVAVHLWQLIPLVGASAAIYGVMTATAILYPDVYISLIFPPVTLKLRTFAIIVILIASLTIVFNWSNAGGEAGHLGGIIMGAALIYAFKKRMGW